ncbi:hypothetical protein [Hydrogenophaga aquatica]
MKEFEVNNLITTGHKNKRLTTDQFIEWLIKRNQERCVELFGLEKYIMNVEEKDGFTLISTYNGSIYTLPFNKNSHDDLVDLTGYRVTLYPKDYGGYELEAFFIWNWERPVNSSDFGFLVINKVVDVQVNDFGGSLLFENGDELKIPYKEYERPYFRASKKTHGDDAAQEGFKIDFASKMAEIKCKFIGKFVVYSTNLKSVDVARISYNTDICAYEDSAYRE